MFCKKNFALKCIPGPVPIGVLPLGQGGRPPEVRWGLDQVDTSRLVIQNHFCMDLGTHYPFLAQHDSR